MTHSARQSAALLTVAMLGCIPTPLDSKGFPDTGGVDDSDADSDTDTDSDTDPESDTDPDPDTAVDTDAGTDTDTGQVCSIVASPTVGSWTATFEPVTDCVCTPANPSCHAIYRGRVDSVAGNVAQLSFQKTTELPPSVDVSYWVAVGDPAEPSCVDLETFVARTTGTWSATSAVNTIGGVEIWPSESDFNAAPAGESKHLFVITGGSDGPSSRTWFQRAALALTKECQ